MMSSARQVQQDVASTRPPRQPKQEPTPKTTIQIDSPFSVGIPSHLEETHVTGAVTPQMSAGLSRPTHMD